MQRIYLALAVLGAVVPWVFFAQHFGAEGPSLLTFLSGAFANPVASGLTADVVISSVVFWGYLLARGEGRRATFLVPINLLIGLSCALPLYLYLRARGGGRGRKPLPHETERTVSPHVG